MASSHYFRLLLMACALVGAGCTTVGNRDGVAYTVKIDGASWKVKKAIREATATCKLVKQAPSTVGQLQHRMEKDRAAIEAILESNGYYDGMVDLELDESRRPVRVYIVVRLGEQYRFGQVDARYHGEGDEALDRIKPRLHRGSRVVAAAVFEEERRILDQIKMRGYPFPDLVRRTVEVNRETQTVDLEFVFDPGPLASYGNVEVEGLEQLDDKFIRRQVPWKEGDRYDVKEVDEFEAKLLGTGLFSFVNVGLQQPEAETHAVPMAIRVSERTTRTVRLGINYSDIGPGAKGYWENRSLFGGGEKLETALSWNPIELLGTGRFTRSGFLDARQYLVLDLEAGMEDPDAYYAKHASGTAMILRDFSSALQGGIGTGYKYSRVEQLSLDERYTHVFYPLQAVFDTRDDALNPLRGMQLFGRTSYFDDMLGADSFLKTQMEGRIYRMLWERYRISSALRMTLGSIDGAPIEKVPADERFYAGGGGSIRGYEYQQVGPQLNGIPAGGDVLVEFSAELRLQPGRRLGYAAFLDGGTVYNEQLDDYNRSLRYGAGAGVRWFTAIGPLRADLAYPLNPIEGQVERIQFYISLGQAF